jgi:hypothetical protein
MKGTVGNPSVGGNVAVTSEKKVEKYEDQKARSRSA